MSFHTGWLPRQPLLPTLPARLLFALQALTLPLPVFAARFSLNHLVEKVEQRSEDGSHPLHPQSGPRSFRSVTRPRVVKRRPTIPELFNGANGQNAAFKVRSTPTSLHNYIYHIYRGGADSRDLGELRRTGPGRPTRASLSFVSTATGWKHMEVRRTLEPDGTPSLQASPDMKFSGCPSVCKVCSRVDGKGAITWKDREFKCKMVIPLENTDHGRNGTCSSRGFPVAKPCTSTGGDSCAGPFGAERCVTTNGFLVDSYGYCRCATQKQLDAQVRQALRGYTCHSVRHSNKFLGFLSVRCYLPRYYRVRPEGRDGLSIYREVVLSEGEAPSAGEDSDGSSSDPENGGVRRQPNAASLFWMDSQILENAIKHPFDEELEALPIWRADCRNETSCTPSGIVRWGTPHVREKYQQVLQQEMQLTVNCTKDVCRNDEVLPILLLVVLGHLHLSRLEVPDREEIFKTAWHAANAALKPAPQKNEKCGAALDGLASPGQPGQSHYDPLRLNESNFPQSIAPCITNIFHDRCKCDGADLTTHGFKQAWCFVEDCQDCADKYNHTPSCVQSKRPWAQCWGDGYAPNRPINGICPTVHECTARPYRGVADLQMVTLSKSVGHPIEGIMTRMYEPMLGQHKNRESTHRVTFTHCVPLGEYSRWLFTGLHVPGKDTVRFRHDIPLNEETVGFSTDIFYSTIGQDLHLKLDMQMYSAWDAGYIDGVIWFDMLQPFGDREMFPMHLPFVSIQRRFKTCMADKLALLYPLMLKLCLAYTEDREIYLSMRATLFGVSLPFSREIHLGKVHVTPDEDGNGHFAGVTAGNFTIAPETVTYYMRETRERTTWDLTKMIVELERRSTEAEQKEEQMEARLEVLEKNVSRVLGKRWLH